MKKLVYEFQRLKQVSESCAGFTFKILPYPKILININDLSLYISINLKLLKIFSNHKPS